MGPKRIVGGIKRRIALRRNDLRERAAVLRHSRDLIWLGQHFKTDKWDPHWYMRHYAKHFAELRRKPINLLEIGVGGYDDPNEGGNSLRAWKAYFTKGQIYGIDIYDKKGLEEKRIHTFRGSQTDEVFLRDLVHRSGGFDIVIDDGSHVNADVIRSFGILFPLLRNPGIYVVEDTQTSYWPGYGGSSQVLGDPATTMGYFTFLCHSLNHQEMIGENVESTQLNREIVAAHFYHNLVFIHKGENSEISNRLTNPNIARLAVEGPGRLSGDGGLANAGAPTGATIADQVAKCQKSA